MIPASPTTLIALLRTVAYGWQQETVAESARAVSKLGRELYERLGIFTGHFASVGKSLDAAMRNYNNAVGSYETRVLVTARKFPELGAGSNELPDVPPISTQSRPLLAAAGRRDDRLERRCSFERRYGFARRCRGGTARPHRRRGVAWFRRGVPCFQTSCACRRNPGNVRRSDSRLMW